jgi:hypothetical protein
MNRLQITIEIDGSMADLMSDGFDDGVGEVGFYFYQPDEVVVECPALSNPVFNDIVNEGEIVEKDEDNTE